ncbi:MAG TPA: arginine deiminase-related protein [Rudaea sp.]|nr:arginine deiminase-related protein [Rudaea sp.]
MIVTSAAEFAAMYTPERFPASRPATPRAAFLVAPYGFSLAAESARDNRYMAMQERADAERALAEHAALAAALRECLPTIVFPGDAETPDAVFPNNVFATAPGRLVVGAMRHAVRRREATRGDIRAFFGDLLGYETLDLSSEPVVAELTGSLVIDRARGIGFCGLSERCDMAGARAMHAAFGLELMFCFELAPGEYHANVVLAILASRAAVMAPDGFADRADAEAIAAVYAPRTLMLDAAQKAAFAGNAIALSDDAVWMSARAAAALREDQRAALAGWGFAPRSVALSEIEKAGGSLRCCVGEIF